MRVLALTGDRPFPAVTGSSVRNLHLWPRLARTPGVELKVLGLDLARDASAGPPTFPGVDAEFHRFSPRSLPAKVLGVYTRSWHEYPQSPALKRRVDEVAAAWRPDLIHAEELRMAAYLPRLRGGSGGALHSVTFHNVESDLYARIASPGVPLGRGLARSLHLASLRRFEARAVAAADLPLAFSPADLARYAALYPSPHWGLTRNGTDVEGIDPPALPGTRTVLILARWSYAPNREGLDWFLRRVRPHLDPSVRVTVAGSGADDAVKAWAADAGYRFVDTPMDLRPLYAEAGVVAVPVLEGGGTRGKILEALAYQRTVVTTTKGPEGLSLGGGEGVVIADDPAEFALRLSEALSAPVAERTAAARRGREAMRARFDWSVVAAELADAWRSRLPR